MALRTQSAGEMCDLSHCCVTASSDTETFHPAGKLLKLKGKQLRIAPENPPKGWDSLGPSLPEEAIKLQRRLSDKPNCKEDPETRPAPWKKQTSAELLRRGLDQLRHLGRTLFNMLSCLPAVHCAPGSQLWELSPILGVGCGFVAVFESFLPLWISLDRFPVSNSHRTHWLTKLDSALSWVSLPSWDEEKCVPWLPMKSFVTQYPHHDCSLNASQCYIQTLPCPKRATMVSLGWDDPNIHLRNLHFEGNTQTDSNSQSPSR